MKYVGTAGTFLDLPKNEFGHNYITMNDLNTYRQICTKCNTYRFAFEKTLLTCEEIIIKNILE